MLEYVMYKDEPVIEIRDYICTVLNYMHTPISLRSMEITYDDIYHGWCETRALNISKTNAKSILAGYNLSQNNKYLIARKFHFATLTDCFWIKEADECINWNDVSFFKNPYDTEVTDTALTGKQHLFSQKLLSPEISTLGVAAKSWVWEGQDLYLFKVGVREVAASLILDALGVEHVHYEFVSANELARVVKDQDRLQKILQNNERIVKCKCLTSELYSICTWEDFRVYQAYHDIDEFEALKPYITSVYKMNIADFILGNSDRHEGNWGFFVDNESGEIVGLHPLMDHDHAFSLDPTLLCQPFDSEITLHDAAIEAIKKVSLNLNAVLQMKKPEYISNLQWNGVLDRVVELKEAAAVNPIKISL